MPRAMQPGKAYAVTNEVGDKRRFVYLGKTPEGKLRLEVEGEEREYADLTEFAGGGFSAIIEL